MPEGWVQTPKTNTTTGSTAGAPISWNDPTNPEDATAGYGYIADDTTDVEDIYYFHSDHLGSTSYVTDRKGNITQYDAYLPYGELLVDEHSSSEDMPYKFNGKEMDEETGLYYYGARYMNPVASIWYGVDIMSESKPDICSFMYCLGNPIDLIDPDGNWERGSNGYLIAQKGDNAVTLAQFTGTCAKEALNLLLANGITVNGKGILNLQIGQRIKSNVLEEVLISARRSNKVTISQPATNKTNSDTPWMTVAQSQLGQTEIKGHRNNPQIVAYHASTTLQAKTDKVAWCSSFVNWTLKQVGIQGTNSASSQSWKHWGQRLKRPVYGCIAILSHKGGGHVAFVAGINKNGRLVLLGGNQHDTVNYSAFKGNMVFVYPKGYMPSSDPLPKSSVNSRSLSFSETR